MADKQSWAQRNDSEAAHAIACKGLVDAAVAENSQHNELYLSAWKSWNEDNKVLNNNADAVKSKDWNKSYFQKLYSDLVSSTNISLRSANCGSTTAEQLFNQPDYSQLQ